jgi:hypothetical protein
MGRPPAGGLPGRIAVLFIPFPDLNRVEPNALPEADMGNQTPLHPSVYGPFSNFQSPGQFIGPDKITGTKQCF